MPATESAPSGVTPDGKNTKKSSASKNADEKAGIPVKEKGTDSAEPSSKRRKIGREASRSRSRSADRRTEKKDRGEKKRKEDRGHDRERGKERGKERKRKEDRGYDREREKDRTRRRERDKVRTDRFGRNRSDSRSSSASSRQNKRRHDKESRRRRGTSDSQDRKREGKKEKESREEKPKEKVSKITDTKEESIKVESKEEKDSKELAAGEDSKSDEKSSGGSAASATPTPVASLVAAKVLPEKAPKVKTISKPLPWAHLKPAGDKGDSKADGDVTKKVPGLDLGKLGDLQKKLAEERNQLRLFVIKAKQDYKKSGGTGETDEHEYYMATPGETLGPKNSLEVVEKIGQGVFSSVYKCKATPDATDLSGDFAIKFVRSNAMMRKVADKEVETYKRLSKMAPQEDPEGAKYVVGLAGPGTFDHRGHLCLCFDFLKCDLRFGLQKYGQGKGLPLPTVQAYGKQIFLALRCLRKLKMIHCDLKPDNLLMSIDKTSVRLIDFGSAMDTSEEVKTDYAQPRYYRAPEIMLGLPYDTQIDTWSAACTLFELATGRILFVGKSNNSMLKQILDTVGAFPYKIATGGEFSRKHFNSSGDFLLKDGESITGESVMKMELFARPKRTVDGMFTQALTDAPAGVDPARHKKMATDLADLITKSCNPDPEKRFYPEDALAHPFFKGAQ